MAARIGKVKETQRGERAGGGPLITRGENLLKIAARLVRYANNVAAPNARRVRMFLAEKGIEIERVEVAFDKGDNQTPEFLALNSLGKVPVLQLDDGRALTESMSICRYLEEEHSNPPLMGVDAYDRAHVDRWNRRMELEVFNIVANFGVHTIPFFKDRVQQIPEFAASQKTVAGAKFA